MKAFVCSEEDEESRKFDVFGFSPNCFPHNIRRRQYQKKIGKQSKEEALEVNGGEL